MADLSINHKMAINEPEETLSVHPKKFLLWMFIVSILMIFAAFTSAYLVRRAEGNWLEFKLPNIFLYSTIVIVLSSITMQWAYLSAKKDKFDILKIAISLTFVLGLAFLLMQWYGWVALVEMNVHFVGNPAGSFVYVLSGLHGLHIVSGLIVLVYALIAAFKMEMHATSLVKIEICNTYWHFLDLLWVYLFAFLAYFN